MGGERAEEKRMGGSNQDEGGYTAGKVSEDGGRGRVSG